MKGTTRCSACHREVARGTERERLTDRTLHYETCTVPRVAEALLQKGAPADALARYFLRVEPA